MSFEPLFMQSHDPVAVEGVLTAGGRVLGPDEDDLRHPVFGVVHAVGMELAGIQDRIVAVSGHHGAQTRRVAGMTGQPQLHPVGASERVAEEGDGTAHVPARALHEDDGFRPELGLDVVEALLYGVEGLVPADALEASLAPFAHALERMGEALGMVDELSEGQSPRADASAAVGMILVTFHLDQAPVLHEELQPAAAVASRSGGPRRRSDYTPLHDASSVDRP